MTVDQYEQLGWSPTLWVLLQLGMGLFTVFVVGLFVWMVYRAGEATSPVQAATPEPAEELEASSGTPSVEPASAESELARV